MLKLRIARTVEESNIKAKVDKAARAQKMSQQFLTLAGKTLDVIEEGVRDYLQVNMNSQAAGGFFGNVGLPPSSDLLSQAVIAFQLKHRNNLLSITLMTTMENSQFVVILRPFTGVSKIFPNGQPVELGRCEIGDAECMSQLCSQLEQRFVICVEEVLIA